MSNYQKQNNNMKQEENKPRKAVIFARVSTSRQGREGLSLSEIQLPRMREYAKEHNLEIVREYKVSETGGRYKKRKKFDEMIEYVKESDFVTDIIAFRVDRITRNYYDSVVVEDMRSKYHKRIHFVDDNFILCENSNRNDLFQWDAKVLFARHYLEGVKEDGINSKNTKLQNGELPWKAPYGYKNQKHVSPRERVIPVEPRASIVQEIFAEFATGIYSCRSLAVEMQRRYGGIGEKFDCGKVNTILNEPFYMGQIRDEDNGMEVFYPHIHPTLVTSETFLACGEVLREHGETHHRSYGSIPAVYRGFIKCDECGCDVIPDFKDKIQKNGNRHHYNYYHCSNAKNKHQTQCNITEEEISNEVRECLSKLILRNYHLQPLSDKIAEKHACQVNFFKNERAKLAKQRGLIKQRQRNTYDMMADQIISKEEYDEGNRRYQDDLLKINEEEERLECIDETFYTTPRYLREIMNHIADLFNVARIDEKRRIIGIIFEIIRLNGRSVEPVIRSYFAPYFE